jgi:hypothetical protein
MSADGPQPQTSSAFLSVVCGDANVELLCHSCHSRLHAAGCTTQD